MNEIDGTQIDNMQLAIFGSMITNSGLNVLTTTHNIAQIEPYFKDSKPDLLTLTEYNTQRMLRGDALLR